MKKAILIGTSHPIQRGHTAKSEEFKSYLKSLCDSYNIKAIAEEIDNECVSIAKQITDEYTLDYKIIEPTLEEQLLLGIKDDNYITENMMTEYDIKYWPSDIESHPLSNKIHEEYDQKKQATYRQREAEWLKRIQALNSWPLLIICGADHYEPFAQLLSENEICVRKDNGRWGLEE